MRDINARTIIIIIYILGVMMIACPVLSSEAIWPMYHYDTYHSGQNIHSTDISNPSGINLIWAFPRSDDGSGKVNEALTIVDDVITSGFVPVGEWPIKMNIRAYNGSYHNASVVTDPLIPAADISTATWPFPSSSDIPKVKYMVYVWIPEVQQPPISIDPEGTHKAHYKIYSDDGVKDIIFDQSKGGGWQPLSSDYFTFAKADNKERKIVLTAFVDVSGMTKDEAQKEATRKVIADAVKFVPVTGLEIYASPASANIPVTLYDPESPTTVIWNNMDATCVYVNTVEREPPVVTGPDSSLNRDKGAIYCIHGISPITRAPDPTNPADANWIKIAKYLGKPKWRYPLNGRDAQSKIDHTDIDSRDATEGPIEGGIYSSPTLGQIHGSETIACYVTGNDRQIYGLDAVSGRPLPGWKGLSLTLPEAPDEGTWTETKTREDAFGGDFIFAECVAASKMSECTATVTWWTKDGGLVPDRVYDLYVWLPAPGGTPKSGGVEYQRTKTATYDISYGTSDGTKSDSVKLDQSDPKYMGTWVLIASHANITQVTLGNTCVSTTAISPSDYAVVADVIRLVPHGVEGFGYASPVTDGVPVAPPNKPNISNVFACSVSGHVMGFEAATGTLKWITADVYNADNSTLRNPVEMGEVGASPVYYNGTLYIASLDGTIETVEEATTKTQENVKLKQIYPVFPTTDASEKIHNAAGFLSSPAIDPDSKRLYIGSTDGYFYGINLENSDSTWQWPRYQAQTNQDTPPTATPPLGGFRYSTPAFATTDNVSRVWCGSTDGHIYSFLAADGTRLCVNDAGNPVYPGPTYAEPTVAPVQGSVALDGTQPVMYFGDMKGGLHWRNARDGSAVTSTTTPDTYDTWNLPDMLFSSPNISDTTVGTADVSWIYVGCADGHLVAFTREGGGWGGFWQGGDWPFEGQPNDNTNKTSAAPNTEIQFDVVTNDFYTNCSMFSPREAEDYNNNEEPYTTAPNRIDDYWPGPYDKIVNRDLKVITAPSLVPPPTTITRPYVELVGNELTRLAKNRRHTIPLAAGRNANTLFFEWGENINLILWNLPGTDFLEGTSPQMRQDNIIFTMTNASAGSSAGSQIVLKSKVEAIKEYTIVYNNSGTYTNLRDENGKSIKRSYAYARIKIDGNGTTPKPPSPGPGWVINVTVRKKDATGLVTNYTMPLAKLDTSGDPLIVRGQYREASVGINNPLAIWDDSYPRNQIGWDLSSKVPGTDGRTKPDVHVNGNAKWTGIRTTEGEYNLVPITPLPSVNMNYVGHGTSSREAPLGVMDRSAMGLPQPAGCDSTLNRFRINSGDLRFRNWPNAVESRPVDSRGNLDNSISYGYKFPWDLGLGSVDYPDIYRRFQTYQQVSSNKDPANIKEIAGIDCPMLRIVGNASDPQYETALLQPDTVLVSVDVPRFQPANTEDEDTSTHLGGYTKTMTAYIDANQNGLYDSGDYVRGRPMAYQEAYRSFRVGVKVPPDPKIEVDEQLIDIGRAPHGLGQEMPEGLKFSAYTADPLIQQWFKKVTIKNAGNVNLYNMRVNQALGLYGDQASPGAVLPGAAITSSLDVPPSPAWFSQEPFATTDAGKLLGYTLSKPRVGDPDPTVMTVPDQRKWDMDYTVKNAAINYIRANQWDTKGGWDPLDPKPLPVKVSVQVPLTQPIGTYGSWDSLNGVPYVAVYSDMAALDATAVNPAASPSFQLKLAVRENQLTGGATPTTLPQIDYKDDGTAPPDILPRVGDATPAAFRDADEANLGVHLFWSSNRFKEIDAVYSNTDDWRAKFASAPWFINHATLGYNRNSNLWVPVSAKSKPTHWWERPSEIIPSNQWVGTSLATSGIIPWEPGTTTEPLYSVRHYSPCIGENRAVARGENVNRTWLAWAGTADKKDPVTNKIIPENYIFYADATHGKIGGQPETADPEPVKIIEHDSTMTKRYPCPVPDGNNMWMFWQGGSSSNWSIYYSFSPDGPFFAEPNEWSPDFKLRTPDSMSSVGSPNPILRQLWVNLRTSTNMDFPDAYRAELLDSKKLFDVVYSGTNKITRNSDIILSRYIASRPGEVFKIPCPKVETQNVQPSRLAQPMPRVFDEKLERDAKFGFYTSQHLAWVRAERGKPLGIDHWGEYTSADMIKFLPNGCRNLDYINPDFPYVRVYFPEDYDDGTNKIAAGTWISATDGSVVVINPKTGAITDVDPPIVIKPEIDDATGIYTYNYERPSSYTGPNYASKILGQMLVDYSSGIVRFTKPLKEVKVPDAVGQRAKAVRFSTPEVHADYTPQALRITTDSAADGSPRAFIEHTSMMGPGGQGKKVPGLGSWDNGKPAPVDRLWVFWRKTGTAVDSSTIFYKTMRIGVDLTKLGLPPIPVDPVSGEIKNVNNVRVENALGPWEVDRTGTKIYFSEVDERYRSMFTQDNSVALGTPPQQITINYPDASGDPIGVTPLDDISWITELPEQSLLGFAADTNVNEGSIYAFADPQPTESGTSASVLASKIWVFWTSTRGGNSDLFWETLCPNFWAR